MAARPHRPSAGPSASPRDSGRAGSRGTARPAGPGTAAARSERSRPAPPGAGGSTASASSGRSRPVAVPLGSVSPKDQIGWSPFGRGDRHPDARAGAVDVPLVVERDRDLDEAVAPAAARRRPARRLRTGSSGVLLAASSLRSLPRSQPLCTKVSLPSGRTSLIVAWRSTFGVEERTQACTAPAPTTVVLPLSGLGQVRDRAARPGSGSTGRSASRSTGRPRRPRCRR